jgi:uncharacterized HhH-GPD family protein
MPARDVTLCFNAQGDALLSRDPFALLVGMLLDQQMPMERAFLGPWRLAERLGSADRLSVAQIASYDPESFIRLVSQPPAVHRFPAAMAGRIQALALHVATDYAGDSEAIWRRVPSGAALFDRILSLPGYGEQKAKILVALLGKQYGVQPRGWREASAPYGDDGSTRSVADVVDLESLKAVRSFKQEAKLTKSR